MYNSYTYNQNGEVIVSDEKTMRLREGHEEIRKELVLENEIEVLNNKINEIESELKNLGTHEENKKIRNNKILKDILVGFGIIIFSEIIFPIFFGNASVTTSPIFWIHSKADVCLVLCTTFYIPGSIFFFNTIQKSYTRIKNKINTKKFLLSELNLEVEQKENELQVIRNNKISKSIKDTTIHNLFSKETKRKILEELKWKTESIRKYKYYKSCYQDKSLERILSAEKLEENKKEFIRRLVKTND